MMYLKAIILYPLELIGILITWLLSPLIALPYYLKERTDRVKRIDKSYAQYTMNRQYLPFPLNYFTTDDNAVDEYFWGLFGFEDWTIEEYYASFLKQYICRILWVCRNPLYKFSRDFLGFQTYYDTVKEVTIGDNYEFTTWTNQDGKKAFLLEASLDFPLLRNIKFGWKAHKGFDRLMYANRLISLREK